MHSINCHFKSFVSFTISNPKNREHKMGFLYCSSPLIENKDLLIEIHRGSKPHSNRRLANNQKHYVVCKQWTKKT